MRSPRFGGRPEAGARKSFGSDNRAYVIPASPSAQVARPRRERHVERICRVPRLVGELLDEIGRHHAISDEINWRLERYAGLDFAVLAAIRGDRWSFGPLHDVPR
jgi:hypothetical protein